jgi:hypothetical protein
MNTLPQEIIDLIASHCNLGSLLQLRLTCRSLSQAATRIVWESRTVKPNAHVLTGFLGLLKRPHLLKHVRRIVLRLRSGSDFRKELYSGCQEALRLVNRFPNLEHVCVDFKYTSEYDSVYWLGTERINREIFRSLFMAKLCAALNDTHHPLPRLHTLSFVHLEDWDSVTIRRSPNFKSLLNRIPELRLGLSGNSESYWMTLSTTALYSYYLKLCETWLEPTREHLTSLTIDSQVSWAYISHKQLLSDVLPLPKLKRLELGHFKITHVWQLDWILIHHNTLEQLRMHNCHIAYYQSHEGILGADGKIVISDPGTPPIYLNDLRWARVFKMLEDGLPHLVEFRFGSANRVTFDNGQLRKKGVYHDRYVAYSGGMWVFWENREVVEDEIYIWPQHEKGVNESDEEAYDHLMAVVNRRRGLYH